MDLLLRTATPLGGCGQWNSCNTLPHYLGQWAVELPLLLQRTASLPRGSGRCNPYIALPHCMGAVGSATPATHCLTARR